MYKIILADGREYSTEWCGAAAGILNAHIITTDNLATLANVFSQEELTQEIRFIYGEMSDTYVGYTYLILMQDQRWQGGGVLVQLRKEAV